MTETAAQSETLLKDDKAAQIAELLIGRLQLNGELADAVRIALAGGDDLSHDQKMIICEAFLSVPQDHTIQASELRAWIAAAFNEFELLTEETLPVVLGQIAARLSTTKEV